MSERTARLEKSSISAPTTDISTRNRRFWFLAGFGWFWTGVGPMWAGLGHLFGRVWLVVGRCWPVLARSRRYLSRGADIKSRERSPDSRKDMRSRLHRDSKGSQSVFFPSGFWEAWGTKSQKTNMFKKRVDFGLADDGGQAKQLRVS
jgi:hypothetical protein